jgi:hypothetical protein
MKAREALDELRKCEEGTIFAAAPRTLDSEAAIFQLEPDKPRPREIADRNLQHFLELHVAREAMGAFGEREPTPDEARALPL